MNLSQESKRYITRVLILLNNFLFRISDEKFWKNYFYNVELIRMKHALKAEEEAEEGIEIQGGGDDVLEPEETEEFKASKSKPKPAKTEEKKQENKSEEDVSTSTQDKSRENESENPDFEIKLNVTP